jgi:hypothetical protein
MLCMLINCFGGYRHHVISYLVLQLYLLDVDVFHKSDLIVCWWRTYIGHQVVAAAGWRSQYFRRPQSRRKYTTLFSSAKQPTKIDYGNFVGRWLTKIGHLFSLA